MKRRVREENNTSVVAERRKQKLLRGGYNYAGGWRAILKKLHFLLDNETDGDALAWIGNGTHFLVQQAEEARLAERLGLRACSLRQALEALNFDCQEESQWDYTIYRHDSFVLGKPDMIEHILTDLDVPLFSSEIDVVMPNVAYSSALKPLEVRLSLPDTNFKSWEVTIAPSVLSHPTFDPKDVFCRHDTTMSVENKVEDSWEGIFDDSSQWSEHDIHSPMWWSQRSDFSSIFTDDLSERDTLSQISAFYG